jgi:prepilin-type processing-associated H-X9-DG protein
MAPCSIRKMMTIVAGAAVCFGIVSGVVRWNERRFACGRLQQCESNMRNIALGVLGLYHSTGSFPSGTVPNARLRPEDRLGLYVPVSPYFDYAGLYDAIDQTEPWNRGSNGSRNLAGVKIGVLICPNSTRAAPPAPQPTTSIGIAGLGADAPLFPKSDPRAGVFGYDRKTTLADIKDGTATTMMLAESGRVIGSWLQGGPATVRGLDPTKVPYIGPGRQFGGLHDGTAVIAMADGSVKVVSESIDPKIFEAMSTIARGERISVP